MATLWISFIEICSRLHSPIEPRAQLRKPSLAIVSVEVCAAVVLGTVTGSAMLLLVLLCNDVTPYESNGSSFFGSTFAFGRRLYHLLT
jgi:hypothetical protein